MTPRARFCPSPTGPFHVGGARTALFNWLFARGNGGRFLLRNEDTDPVRSEERWLEGILDGLRWLGLDWDEDIVRQSARRDEHVAAAERLVESGHAYWCDCTPEAIEARRPAGSPPGYDGFCRGRGLGPADDRVVRFRVPDEGTTTVVDVIRDSAAFENATIDDFVIVRRGGAPMFMLANVVDDDFQQVTHVVRGEEHLSTTPKYLLIRHALGMGPDPVFAHLPLLVNEKRQKLSKRRDKVQLLQYRDEGYLAEAMRNYLALLGWSPRDGEEITTVEKMVEQFRLEDVSRAPAFFDEQKLQHFNAHYIREMSAEDFAAAARPFVEPAVDRFDPELFAQVAPLAQTRVKILSEVPDLIGFLFSDRVEFDDASWEKAIVKNDWSGDVLREAASLYPDLAWETEALKDATQALGERRGLKLGKTQAPIRVAVTGRTVGPPLFESLEALGREATLARIGTALERLP
ncbi:MAG TPA: glutamate--tRNA ligase [Solirubrobacteraceae bacterium]|nr:glutamate--tRNA ligase [Solirubrobacteraceae bacterium]